MKNNDKSFIVDLAVHQFNEQYHTDLKTKDMDARSISAGDLYDVAYEVFTATSNDNVRLRLYFNRDDDTTGLTRFRYLSSDLDPLTSVLNTTYTATGSIDEHYLWSNIIDLKNIEIDVDKVGALSTELNGGMLLESGGAFLLENNRSRL